MPKVTFQPKLKEARDIAAIYTIARLLEFYETDRHASVNDLNRDEEEFWGQELPIALNVVANAIQYLCTEHRWQDGELAWLFSYTDDWTLALNYWKRTIRTLCEMEKQAGFSHAVTDIDRGKDDEQIRANGE